MTHYNEVKVCRTNVHQWRTLLMLLLVLGGGEAMAQVRIHGSVFGGGNNAEVRIDTKVDISDGIVMENVYGGGKKGDIKGTTEVNICAKESTTPGTYEAVEEGNHGVTIEGDVFGGGQGDDDNFFCDKAMVGVDGDGIAHPEGGTTVRIGNGTINGNVYGGGEIGRIEKNTVVTIGFGDGGNNSSTPYIKGHVFGAGKGVSTHGFSALVRGNSTVTIAGDTQIGKNVYGGGQIATVGRYVVVNSRPTKSSSGGLCTVNILGHTIIGKDADENIKGDVFGAGKGLLPYEGWDNSTPWSMLADNTHNEYTTDKKADYFVFIQTLALASDTEVTIGGNATVKGSAYGGSENGFVQRYTHVTIQGSSEIGTTDNDNKDQNGNIFGGGRGDDSVEGYAEAGKVKGNTNVTTNGGTMHGSVYGGGEKGYTIGSATVNILSGTINHDVYGGGALADTNKGNGTDYVPVSGIEVGNDVTGLYENTYVKTSDTEILANKTYYNANGTPITGTLTIENLGNYYEWSETNYAESDGTAKQGKIYYTKTHPTTVNLFGGLIKGDAYGGGLGRLADTPNSVTAVQAKVYGDVTVNLGNPDEADVDDARATAFELATTSGTISQTTYSGIASSGRIFGCNNLNGSPKGAVTVNVYRTTALTYAGEIADKPTKTEHNTDPGGYELAAVYGGGNLAMYDPTNAETPAKVNIYGCGLTSIKQVYGGGNAAPVPGSEVMVEGTYEIYQVFGGGNGKDIIQKNGVWMENPGADVGIKSYTGTTPNLYGDNTSETSIIGVAKVSILGGTIHYVFGGSNTKGDVIKNSCLILGSENIQACEYNVGKAYGGANDAPMSGDIVIEMGCTEGLETIYGGARNADVNGNIVLNITGGHFGKVFGGNDNGGAIQGSITVNIEERSCLPIEIDELYGGGENAPYSIFGYEKDANGNIVKDDNQRPTVLTSGNNPYKDPQVNIISATSIGTIYGGGYGVTATMVGNPHVNINMTQGSIDGKYSYQAGKSDDRYNENGTNYYFKDANNNKLVLTSTEQTASSYPKKLNLGTVGNVFGGGNEANVIGNTVISIGTGEWLNKNGEREMLGTTTTITEPTLFTYKKPSESATSEAWTYLVTTTTTNQETGETTTTTAITPIEGTPTPARNAAQILGSVYGGGKGKSDNIESALVTGNTTVTMAGGDVKESVYGGGQLSQVGGNTNITVSGGTIGTPKDGETVYGGATYGNIYGGGLGSSDNVRFGLVKGNTNVTVTGGSVLHSVYGGGAYGSVGTYTYASNNANAAISNRPDNNTGKATIHITGGTIGTDGHENGMVFGSSRGDIAAPDAIQDNMAWVYDTEVVIGTENDETSGPTIHGSLYGSGENGHTFHDASVTMWSGTVGNPEEFYAYRGNVYGGGCGTDKYYENAENEKHDGKGTLYNPTAGIVKVNATVEIHGGSVANNIYGAGAMGKVKGSTSVVINTEGSVGVDGDHDDGNVYGAARGELGLSNDYASVTNSSVTITKGTVKGSVYGGGRAGVVTGQVVVNLNGGTVKHDVYGGGALAQTNTLYDGANETYKTYVTNVNLAGTTVNGNLYGGGLGQLASAGTDEVLYTAEDAEVIAGTKQVGDVKTPATAAQTAVAANVNGPVKVSVTNGSASNVFGCNNLNGAPKTTVDIEIGAKTGEAPSITYTGSATVSGSVYGGGNMAAYAGSPAVKIYSGTVNTNVYGGGLGATAVTGGTSVTMEGGTVDNDVYGGGSQADVTGSVAVTIAGGTVTHDVYGGGALANTNTANWNTSSNTWADGMDSNSNTTTITLTGGTIGNVYGGALGQHAVGTPGDPGYIAAIEPNVYGDIALTVNNELATGRAKFLREYETHDYMGTYKDAYDNIQTKQVTGTVYTKGNVFGANNKEGTPKGNIQVTVWSTTPIDYDGTGAIKHEYGKYEIQNVYGGGNLSAYVPAEGKATHVDVHGCDRTSIQFVFGGGNAAPVPVTNVTIYGSYEIETVFGGGNGSQPIWSQSQEEWIESPGASVTTSNVTLKGGYIHSAFGGSYERGTVVNVNLDKSGTGGECILRVTDVFGGGKDADVTKDINITISDCTGWGSLIDPDQSADYIKNVYAGSYNARIFGNVTMTVTSGVFTNVFGGNHTSGFINGKITINIEETEACKPVIIDNLYGGGNYAAYPGAGANNGDPKITINVKAATRIGNIYGGCNHNDVTGDTEVNINMIKGWWAGRTYENEAIPDSIGVIGHVYGGGNEGRVIGNTTVNIATEKTVTLVSTPKDDVNANPVAPPAHLASDTNTYNVLGAKITGNVFGGCNKDDVTGNTTVNICTADYSETTGFEGVSIGESVYGGGNAGNVEGNTFVNMSGGNRTEVDGAYVFDGVYGGGLHGSVGTAAVDDEGNVLPGAIVYHTGEQEHAGCIGKIVNYKENTGKCTVVVNGGQVGPVETALATGGMKNTKRYYKDPKDQTDVGPVDYGFVFGAGRGDVENPATSPDADFHTFVKETDVTIGGTAFIMASVYGGGENGRVLGDTHVTIKGDCQIGCGEGKVEEGKPVRYTTEQWNGENANNFTECASWDYKSPFLPHDPYAQTSDTEDAKEGTDGHTYYGSVFGGGSGYYPYKKADGSHEWLRSAGIVYGNTVIDITGGHILTCVYGGNETTDVGTYSNNTKGQPLVHESGGKCTINMVGGTIGVPRTDENAKKRPVTCYLFGAGKGDQRTQFNTWTNVQETEVNVSGTARIFGSVFGGGEDGHILGDAKVNIGGTVKIDLNGDDDTDDEGETFTAQSGLKIGTKGTSYVDGNVFGGGRGFSGLALTAGSVGGNAEVNIAGGTMLGSIYGGGRLASVGIDFTPPTDPLYGQLVDDTNEKTHGHIAINISGGTIGNDVANAKYGGNVFGGSMGRITLLDESLNPIWPKQAVTKETEVTITGNAIIKRNVYGGSEYGIVRDKAIVNISGDGTVDGNVYGGGYGSDDDTPTYITAGDYAPGADYVFTPMIWTGCVSGDTEVNISGGTVKKNVYGGGEMASVGLINCHVVEDNNGDITIGTKKYRYTAMTKHDVQGTGSDEKAYSFALSWPYEFTYIPANPKSDHIGGKATVNISGGTIGDDGDTGYIFGGGKGRVWFGATENTVEDISGQRYKEAFCANVRETLVTIEEGANVRTVYGGGDDGHVEENTNVIINGGTIAHSVFGGGKGTSTFTATLLDPTKATPTPKGSPESVHSWTAGKVYGNTNVTMNGGNVGWFIYGGGNLASVGKGNYAGGKDDYSQAGYGELPEKEEDSENSGSYIGGNLWTTSYTAQNPTKDMAYYFLNSGIATVNLYGGSVGTTNGFEVSENTYKSYDDDGIPYGSIFGGSRGKAAKTASQSPRYKYVPDFFLGYVNKAIVNVGDATKINDNNYTGPTIYGSVYAGGQDGHVRNSTELKVYKANISGQTTDAEDRSGHIFGAGSGIGTYLDDSDNKDKMHYGSGSVTCTTFVEVNKGANIHGNVYGGGAMATVGPPKIPVDRPDDEQKEVTSSSTHQSCSYTRVDINGGSIGGSVFGASRGPSVSFYAGNFSTAENDGKEEYTPDKFATSIWSTVNINGGEIAGNVYGGGEGGLVKKDIKVHLNGGKITNDAYGGGKGHKYIAADVGGDVTLELNNNNNGADADGTKTGCIVKRIFGCNDVNGTPKGHVLVHVYATQHPNTIDKPHMEDKYERYGNVTTYTAASDLTAFATAVGMTETERTPYETAITNAGPNDKAAKIEEYRNAISLKKYDVEAVYGGGNLAAYEPTDASATDEATKEAARTEVIIDGCALTSIKQVYGGSNAASTPATLVRVNEAYEIDELFGGGNGKDMYQDPKDNKWYKNPGANVGYKDFTVKGNESGTDKNNAISQTDNPNYDTAEERLAATSLHYGSGIANIMVTGGRIHLAYGGSNSRGNIRTKATSLYQESGTCNLEIDKSYGAGKDAQTDAQVVLNMDCVTNMDQLFGGSTNADVNNDIYLRVTNGTYNQVFGGNDTNGAIHGSITVEIEENGCTPIEIKELYAGGYLAPYSVYGYKKDDNGRLIPLQADDKDAETKKLDPHINVISATKIGDIYGGGYKAEVVGNPHINVNMTTGKVNLKKVEVKLIGGVYKDDDGNTYNKYVFEEGSDPKKYYVYADGANVSYDSTVEGNVQTETTNEGTNYYHTQTTGYIGNIFGGGNEADIWGNTYIDIGTGKWIKRTRDPQTGKVSETDANHNVIEETLTRNKAELLVADGETKPYFGNFGLGGGYVFGGGNQGIVKGNTYITMGNGATVGNSIFGGGNLGSVGTFTGDADHRNYSFKDTDGNANGTDDTKNTGICNVTITGGTVGPADPTETVPGNVFGGGRGSDTDYYCEEAMAYGTNISITNGIVNGNIYGGGKIARLEHNASVTIGIEGNEDSAPEIKGDVFGAGKGLETHGYSALVRGNPSVTVQGKAKVRGSVYGGGEIASVARYKVDETTGLPVAVENTSSGNCKVVVRDYAEIGPEAGMQMKKFDGSGNPLPPDDKGHVFGAGKGVLPKVYSYADNAHRPKCMLAAGTTLSSEASTWDSANEHNIWEYFGNDADYHGFIETLALSSTADVTVGGHAFVKGSVYGGSENGIVQYNTHVTIQDHCQIGNGDGVNRRYTDAEWTAGKLEDVAGYENSLPECAHWDYDNSSGVSYDKYATYLNPTDKKYYYDAYYTQSSRGGSYIAKDGHTYYGNVFGGGSGVIPYAPGKWHRAAGVVRGNTVLDITGGHILTSVYGGNEHTDVGMYDKDTSGEPTIPKSGGLCTVNFGGTATLGVPRTLEQIAAHPVTCYLFGAGKGDTRTFFNTWTNIKEAIVNITGGRIYGSVFGGGEDGHVMENVTVNISGDAKIGTWGTSYVDGNVFGAGRGFTGDAITAGSVGGNVNVNISGGTMLGSVYGGGRLASVGIGFHAITDANYGQFTDDDRYTTDDQTAGTIPEGKEVGDVKAYTHGHITVDISGGIIGNDKEVLTDVNNSHTKGGNVYGGSMGRLELLDGTTPNPLWPQLGQAKTTTVKISGTALIKSNVYGGGEMGIVRDNTNITINGGTVNRDVYGGGYGSDKIGEKYNAIVETVDQENHPVFFGYNPMKWAGLVGKETNVTISGGRVKKSVYGGGEMASVGIINYMLTKDVEYETVPADKVVFSHTDGTNKYTIYSNIVKHADANSSFALSWPYKVEYMDNYEGKTNVTITGGRIGLTSVEDEDDNNPFFEKDNGDVYGGGKGIAGDFNDYIFCANVGSSEITINYPTDDDPNNDVTPENYMSSETIECVAGAVYGGAENGHVMGDTKVTLTNGLIGHSLYGGGSGKGQYTTTLTRIPNDRVKVVNNGVATQATYENGNYDATIYSITAGKVFGNTEIEMTGGRVVRNVYGGGNMGSVGKGNYAGGPDDYSTAGYGEKLTGENNLLWDGNNEFSQAFLNSGKCTVKVTGGTVGYIDSNPDKSMYPLKNKQKYDASLPYGNVFGGCRGEAAPNILESPRYLYSPEFFVGYANETEVTIGTIGQSNDDAGQVGKAPLILGSVYGGGQDGHLRRDTHVTVNSGEIGLAYNSDNQTKVLKTSNLDDLQWLARGNVYGAGSGIGKYRYDFNYDGNFVDEIDYTTPGDNGRTSRLNEEDNSASAGSVTRFTQVEIHGGIIHRNVYGGGSMASVGAPKIGQDYIPYRKGDTVTGHGEGKQSLNQVNIASTIGTPENYNEVYGGEVYGASRGIDANNTSMATSVWTEVNLLPGAYVQGNVFGGGDNGMVKQDAEVNVGTPWTATIEAGNIPLMGGSKKITITTKDKWTVTSNVDWLTISPSSGEGDGTITVTAPTAAQSRTATITITGTGRSQTFTITQE